MDSNLASAAYDVARTVGGTAARTATSGVVQETINAALQNPEVLLGLAFLGAAVGAGFWAGLEICRLLMRLLGWVFKLAWRIAGGKPKEAGSAEHTGNRRSRAPVSLTPPRHREQGQS